MFKDSTIVTTVLIRSGFGGFHISQLQTNRYLRKNYMSQFPEEKHNKGFGDRKSARIHFVCVFELHPCRMSVQTLFLSENGVRACDILQLIYQEEKRGNNSEKKMF